MNRVIFICGMPGSGKTFLGKSIAFKHGYNFIDLDEYIEEITTLSTAKWIKQKGEEAFRVKEGEILRQLPLSANQLISCGAGTPCFMNNLQWMAEHGTVIFLDVVPELLIERLSTQVEVEKRPLLNKPGVPLSKILLEMWEKRKNIYLQIPTWLSEYEELEEFILKKFETSQFDSN